MVVLSTATMRQSSADNNGTGTNIGFDIPWEKMGIYDLIICTSLFIIISFGGKTRGASFVEEESIFILLAGRSGIRFRFACPVIVKVAFHIELSFASVAWMRQLPLEPFCDQSPFVVVFSIPNS
jgi:hypothetical protein